MKLGKNGNGVIMGVAVPIAAGGAAGVLLNDIWEGALTNGVPLPGYGQKLMDIGTTPSGAAVGFGVDDAFQIGVGAGVAALGHFALGSFFRNLGIGMIGGWAVAKVGEFQPGVRSTDAQGEYFRNPISFIPHRYPDASAAALRSGALVEGSNLVPSNAYFVNVP